jgi:hypothetical protein
MINEIIDFLLKEIHLPFGIVLAVIIEAFKFAVLRLECGKYVFIFDRNEVIKFNLRLAIIGLSAVFFIVVLLIEKSFEIVPSLLITFFVANFFYEYFLKYIVRKIKN